MRACVVFGSGSQQDPPPPTAVTALPIIPVGSSLSVSLSTVPMAPVLASGSVPVPTRIHEPGS